MSNPSNPVTPAGWYPDPSGDGRSRWWDGTRWTDHYAPAPGTNPQVPQPPQPHFAPQAPQHQHYAQQQYAQQPYVAAPALRAPEGTKPNTPFIWAFCAILIVPIIAFALWDFSGMMTSSFSSALNDPTNPYAAYGALLNPGYFAVIGVGFVYYAASVVLAFLDYRALTTAGVPKPFHWAWTFLSALVYIIGRTVIVKRRTGAGLGPLWLYLGLYLLYIIVVFAKTFIATAELMQYGTTTLSGLT